MIILVVVIAQSGSLSNQFKVVPLFRWLVFLHVITWSCFLIRNETAYVLRKLQSWTNESGCSAHFPGKTKTVNQG